MKLFIAIREQNKWPTIRKRFKYNNGVGANIGKTSGNTANVWLR